jgi:hypothetical protein
VSAARQPSERSRSEHGARRSERAEEATWEAKGFMEHWRARTCAPIRSTWSTWSADCSVFRRVCALRRNTGVTHRAALGRIGFVASPRAAARLPVQCCLLLLDETRTSSLSRTLFGPE